MGSIYNSGSAVVGGTPPGRVPTYTEAAEWHRFTIFLNRMQALYRSLWLGTLLAAAGTCIQSCRLSEQRVPYRNVTNAMRAGNPNRLAVPDTIPFEYINRVIIVKGQINGKPYRFIFDTGAPTIIWNEAARELGLAKATVSSTARDARGTVLGLDLYAAERVQVGRLLVGQMNVASLSTIASELQCYANGGILGSTFIRHYNWQIDYVHKRLIVATDFAQLKLPNQVIKVNALGKRAEKLMLGNFSLLGKRETFLVDTGSSGYINLDTETWSPKNVAGPTAHVVGQGYSKLGAGGRTKITTYALRADLSTPVGTVPNAVLEANTERSKLGNGFFAQFGLITLAYTPEQPAVYFPTRTVTAAPLETFGFRPIFAEEKKAVIVGHLYQHSAAEQAGLQVDDVILTLNGRDLSQLDFATYCRNNAAGVPSFPLEGDSVSLTVLRSGQKLTFAFRKRSLFPG